MSGTKGACKQGECHRSDAWNEGWEGADAEWKARKVARALRQSTLSDTKRWHDSCLACICRATPRQP
jgi:hypothetical protein